jgi:hypothetical protein
VGNDPGALQFLGDEPPAGGGLHGEVHLLSVELLQPAAQPRRVAGRSCPRRVSPVSVSIQS